MKKNFLQDVIPPVQRRSIRDIPIPGGAAHKKHHEEEKEFTQDIHLHKIHKQEDEEYLENDSDSPQTSREKVIREFLEDEPAKKSFSKFVFAIVLLIFISGLFFLSRTKAEITILPKKTEVNLLQSFDIFDKDKVLDKGVGLGYKKLEIQKSASISIEPSGEQNVSQKAVGRIKVFNKNTSKAKTLIANTRFETDKGLIFRVTKDVQIPGYTESNGKIIPGEIEIDVIADKTGKEYNIAKTNFTIPGFKDFPDLYSTIYAESVSEMTGGFEGKKKVVSEQDKTRALEDLKAQVNDSLQNEIKSAEDQFIIVYGADDLSYSGLKEEDQNSKIVLTLNSVLKAYAFEMNEFAEYIGKNNIPGPDFSGITLRNKNDIKFEIENNSEVDKKLSVSGLANLEWQIDENKIKDSLTGKTEAESKAILSSLGEISSAEISLEPFWKTTLPKASKIKLIINK